MSVDYQVVPDWTLGWRMQRALAHAGLKVEDIADEFGVGRSTVSRWINDRGLVRPVYLRQWALRCGVSYDWLLTGEQSNPRSPDGGLGNTGMFAPTLHIAPRLVA